MANSYFQFKQFTIYHDQCAMKVTTDSCFFGAWTAREIKNNPDSYREKIKHALDIGTGTGLLSLMIRQENELVIDAVEIDKEASQQAKENIEVSPWKNQIHIFNEDITSFKPNKKYDCIVSNPPFYENELASGKLKKNIAHHSERLTLSQVLTIIKIHLKKDGLFFLMYPFKRKQEVEQLFQQNKFYIINSVILSQSSKHSPFRMIVKATNKKNNSQNLTSIAIWDEHQQYTEQFIDLVKDYYLYL